MYNYAVIVADLNSSDLGDVRSQHKTEAAAQRALDKLGNIRGAYVAHKLFSGEWERRLDARDRAERV